MKKCILIALLISTPVFAQTEPTPEERQAQSRQELDKLRQESKGAPLSAENMQAVTDMYKCIDGPLGKSSMDRIEQQGVTEASAIAQLCNDQKKKEAVTLQNEYAAKMAASKEYKALHDCSQKYPKVMESPVGSKFMDQMLRAVPRKEDDICS